MVLSILSVVVVVLAIGVFLLPSGGGGSNQAGQSPATTDPDAPGTTVPESQLTTVKEDSLGFSMKYPKTWTRIDSGNPEIPLALSAGGSDGVWVRLDRTEVPTSAANIANIKAFTDGAVGRNETAKILQQRQVAVDNMPGYYYLYTFTDEASGAEGVHAHYFLFRGRKMYTVVLQAVPSDGFARLAGVFDQTVESIRTTPDLPVSAAPSSTPAG